jgi:hypothetical protein
MPDGISISLRVAIARVTKPGTLPEPTPRYVGHRVKHASEPGARQTPNGMPEVNPSENINGIDFTREMQLLSWEVMRTINPLITKHKWRVVYATSTAFTNGQGFVDSSDPRADYVNGISLDAPLPRLMKGIVSGGAFLRGVMGSEFVVTPGVGAVDCTKPLPTAQEVIQRRLYFEATTARYNSEGVWSVNPFPQGGSGPVAIVYFLNTPARYVSSWFQPWEEDFLPDPYKVYL